MSSSTANANLKFWVASISTPITSKSFYIAETILYNTESGSAVTQMVGLTYKQDSGIPIYMFQSKDLYNLKSTNLIYIPDKGT